MILHVPASENGLPKDFMAPGAFCELPGNMVSPYSSRIVNVEPSRKVSVRVTNELPS